MALSGRGDGLWGGGGRREAAVTSPNRSIKRPIQSEIDYSSEMMSIHVVHQLTSVTLIKEIVIQMMIVLVT